MSRFTKEIENGSLGSDCMGPPMSQEAEVTIELSYDMEIEELGPNDAYVGHM